ncbi:hypothetical protein [Candidatus Vampirococcus lugosii]|uniref:Toxic anion resistance protein n=1 Tax=Candidatus Vampirococcus lugosii TaxID=2789015 RepID=A0ABS5QMH8_9BACT|nr:hypothetical protein [Candidatus Vampirococcus lugosii]MBS8122279.1 hypothetical protein [Candidatus Vampirococcus lugosii]
MENNVKDNIQNNNLSNNLANTEIKQIELSEEETKEIQKAFEEAKNFRSIGERITAPIDDIVSKTAKVIDGDPIMSVSDELEKMNGEVQGVYRDIIDNDGSFMKFMKSIPGIGSVVTKIDNAKDDMSFNMKTVEGKIETIFSGFDQAYYSINTSIDMQNNFLDGVEENLGSIVSYKDYIGKKVDELQGRIDNEENEDEKRKLSMFKQNVEFFLTNIVVLIGNLEMAKKRLEMRLDSATKLALSMNSSRPIFKTLLSTAIIETSSQKSIDASMKAMDVMGSTIDKMSSDLTDKAIEGSKKAEEVASKPVVSTTVFMENVTKLKNHFDEIENFREQVAREAKEERKLFGEARAKLDDIKVMNKDDANELKNTLSDEESQEKELVEIMDKEEDKKQ